MTARRLLSSLLVVPEEDEEPQLRRSRRDWVVDLSLFKLRFFSAANVSAFLFSAAFFGMFFTNIGFLQNVLHYSPSRSGLASAPGPLMAAIVAGPAGTAAAQRGHKLIIGIGLAFFTAGLVLMYNVVSPTVSYWAFLPAYLVTGFGVGLTISTLGSASSAFLPPHRFGMGSAVNSTGRQIGAGMGIAAVTALRIAAADHDVMTGVRRSWLFSIVMAALAFIAMAVIYRKPTAAEIDASRVRPAAAR